MLKGYWIVLVYFEEGIFVRSRKKDRAQERLLGPGFQSRLQIDKQLSCQHPCYIF